MKRLLAATAVALALPLLAACSGNGPSPTAAPTPLESEATKAPDIASGDEFCDLAVASVPVGEAIETKTADMSTTVVEALGAGDMATINTWGTELAELDEQMLQFYADGRPYIEGDSVEGAWNLMEQFVREYSLAVAQEAAVATDPTDFTARLGEIVQNPEVQAAVNFGPAAATNIREYIVTRCGPVDAV
jgi:hypothetical protein